MMTMKLKYFLTLCFLFLLVSHAYASNNHHFSCTQIESDWQCQQRIKVELLKLKNYYSHNAYTCGSSAKMLKESESSWQRYYDHTLLLLKHHATLSEDDKLYIENQLLLNRILDISDIWGPCDHGFASFSPLPSPKTQYPSTYTYHFQYCPIDKTEGFNRKYSICLFLKQKYLTSILDFYETNITDGLFLSDKVALSEFKQNKAAWSDYQQAISRAYDIEFSEGSIRYTGPLIKQNIYLQLYIQHLYQLWGNPNLPFPEFINEQYDD